MQAAMVTADIFVTHVVFQVLRILLSMGPVFSHTLHSITMVRQRMANSSSSGGGVHPRLSFQTTLAAEAGGAPRRMRYTSGVAQ